MNAAERLAALVAEALRDATDPDGFARLSRAARIAEPVAARFALSDDDAKRSRALAAHAFSVAMASRGEGAHPIAAVAFNATAALATALAVDAIPASDGERVAAADQCKRAIASVRTAAEALDVATTMGAIATLRAPDSERSRFAALRASNAEQDAALPDDIFEPIAALLQRDNIDAAALRAFADDIGMVALMFDVEAPIGAEHPDA